MLVVKPKPCSSLIPIWSLFLTLCLSLYIQRVPIVAEDGPISHIREVGVFSCYFLFLMLCTTTSVKMAMLQCIAVSSWTRKNSNFFCAFKSLYPYFMAMRCKHRHIVKWKILLLECVWVNQMYFQTLTLKDHPVGYQQCRMLAFIHIRWCLCIDEHHSGFEW
jgi:hypothetical protein